MTLSVLAPTTITDAMLYSSSVAETEYAAWSAATTYAVNEFCISTTTHRVYQSLVASNINHDPTDINNRVNTPAYWLDYGPTNKWAMFDSLVSSKTTIATSLTVVVRPGFFNALALFGLDADNIAITVKDAPGGNVIYSYSGLLEGSAPPDWYEYFFDRFKPQLDFLASGIDQYNAAELTLTLSKTSGTVGCGMLAVGDLRPLGMTQYGAKAKPTTFAYIDIDKRGNNTIIPGKSAKDLSLTAWVDQTESDSVLQIVNDLLAVPCVWVGTELPGYSGLRVFGLGSGEMSYDHPNVDLLTIEVRGLT